MSFNIENNEIGSERQDLEYVEAVLEGRVTTTGRFGGQRNQPYSSSHARRRERRAGQRDRRQPGRGRRQHSRRQGGGQLEREPSLALDSIDSLLQENTGFPDGRDPIMNTLEFESFLTVVRIQGFMMYGESLVYRRCLDIFRGYSLAEAFRQGVARLADTKEMNSLFILRSCSEIASFSWLLATHNMPAHICFELNQDVASVGDFGAWMASVVFFLHHFKKFPDNSIRQVDMRIRCDLIPERATNVILQGLLHVSISVKQISAILDKALHILFVLHGLTSMDDASGLKKGLEAFQNELLETVNLRNTNLLGPEQKLAFLMGMHTRLGRMSPVYTLHRDIVERIFRIIEQERVSIGFSDPMESDPDEFHR